LELGLPELNSLKLASTVLALVLKRLLRHAVNAKIGLKTSEEAALLRARGNMSNIKEGNV